MMLVFQPNRNEVNICHLVVGMGRISLLEWNGLVISVGSKFPFLLTLKPRCCKQSNPIGCGVGHPVMVMGEISFSVQWVRGF